MTDENLSSTWETKSTEKIYDNPWITVEHHEVIDPSGKDGIYGKVHFKNIAIGILPIDDEGNTWIVGQHRYPLNRYSWEIPEGGGPLDIDPLLSAQRELREEAGIIAQDWQLLLEADISNSVTDEHCMIYVAKDLSFVEQELESTEDITVRKLPFEELLQMVMDGEVRDSLTVMGVLRYGMNIPRSTMTCHA